MSRALLLWAGAWLCHLVTAGGFWWISSAAYAVPRALSEGLELPLTFAGLVVGGPLALLLAAAGVFRALRHSRLWIGLPCVLLLGVPALLVSVLFSYTLACVRGWW